MTQRISRVCFALVLIACGFASGAARADDWPQWLGPQRDGVWREKGIVDKFPDGGPKILWRNPVGGGYAGPAVAGGKVYVLDRILAKDAENPKNPFSRKEKIPGEERVICFDAASGKIFWEHKYDCTYEGLSYATGPRCTPLIAGGKVYTLGAMGHLVCLDANKGTPIWSKQLMKEYGLDTLPGSGWGFSGHPLLDGDRLICLVGGKGSIVVAFDKDKGTEIWKALNAAQPGYDPPTLIEHEGKRMLVIRSEERRVGKECRSRGAPYH